MPKWKGKKDRVTKGPTHVRYNAAAFRTPHPLLDKVYCTQFAANGMRDVFVSILPHPTRLAAANPSLYQEKLNLAKMAANNWFKAHGSKNRKKH